MKFIFIRLKELLQELNLQLLERLDNFAIKPFYKMINNLDPDVKFISTNTSKTLHFIDINIEIVDNNLVFDIYYEPTNCYSYLPYTSCHPTHK